jgi:hypothetical protein
VRRLAPLLFLLVTAAAGWPPAREQPSAGVAYEARTDGGVSVVRIDRRGERAVKVPGSEGATQATVDADARGNVVVLWWSCTSGPLHDGGGFCSGLHVSSWRAGGSPPTGQSIHPGGFGSAAARVVGGRLAVVTWEPGGNPFDEGESPEGLLTAAAPLGGAFVRSKLAGPGTTLVALPAPGDPRAAFRLRRRNGDVVRRELRRDGRPGPHRIEARLPRGGDVAVLVSARGDRALLHGGSGPRTLVRLARPDRPYGPPRTLPVVMESAYAVIGPRGHVAVSDFDGHARVFRGLPGDPWRRDVSTGRRRLAAQTPDIEVDATGRTYVVVNEDARPRPSHGWSAVLATHAAWGRPFADLAVLRRSTRKWGCGSRGVFAVGRDRAEAVVTCDTVDAIHERTYRSRFRP